MLCSKINPLAFAFNLCPSLICSLLYCLFSQATDNTCSASVRIWYRDSDGDGFGNPDTAKLAVTQPVAFVADKTDCNDDDSSITNEAINFWENMEICLPISGYNLEGNGLCLDDGDNFYDGLSYKMQFVEDFMHPEDCAAACTSCFCADDIIDYSALHGIVYRGFQYFGSQLILSFHNHIVIVDVLLMPLTRPRTY